MTNLRLKLPHISRIFSASLWLLLCTLMGYNIFVLSHIKPLAYSDKVFQIFIHPFSALPHENLAQTLEGSSADQERAIVAELSPVLGAETTEREQQETRNMQYWEQIANSHPDYRDSYLQLAQLNYQNGNLLQTQADLLKAQALDPNNTTVHRLVAFTSKLLE